MNSELLKVGIAGYGVVGRRRHECIKKSTYMELVAVCDKNSVDNHILNEDIKFFTNYKDLLKEKLDILIVCMTNDIAPEVTKAGLSIGLHVFCEKPPGRNLQDILGVIQEEKEASDSVLMYGFNHRYHDSVQDALKIIQSGKLGKIINLKGEYGKSKMITFNQTDWRTKREIAGGGVLLDQGIHMVDLMRFFAGDFVKVKSFIKNNFWDYDVEDNAYAIMETNTGIVGVLNSSATQWRHKFNLDITLERGNLILEGILTSSKSYGEETLTIVNVDHSNNSGMPDEEVIKYVEDPSWQLEMDHFVDCILQKKQVEYGSSKDAFETMKLVYNIYYADEIWRDKYIIPNPSEYEQ